MHGIMEEQLVGARITSSDGSLVTYDLRQNTDYLTPRELGLALSEVFFKNDGIYWFSIKGKTIKFTPGYRVKILFSEKNAEESRTVMSYFYYNIEHDLIPRNFADQLRGSFDESFGLVGKTRETLYSAEFRNNIMENIEVDYL